MDHQDEHLIPIKRIMNTLSLALTDPERETESRILGELFGRRLELDYLIPNWMTIQR